MYRTVGELKLSVAGLLQGTNLQRVTYPNGALERATRTMLQQADVPEASATDAITLYGGVPFYEIPQTIFGGALNLILPQGAQNNWLSQNYKVQLDRFSQDQYRLPNGYMVTVQYQNGQPVLGVGTPNIFPQAILSTMNETTGWTVGGTATGLARDVSVYYKQPASLRFSVGTGVGSISDTLPNPIDLSVEQGVGVAFLAVYVPDIANLTSFTLRVGSDSSNYNSVTGTVQTLGAFVSGQWMLIPFDFASASTTGTPNWSAIQYVDVLTTVSGTLTNIRMGGLWISLPQPHDLFYQTAAIFKNPLTGVLSNVISDDSDFIILSDPAYTLLEHESALTIAFQNGGNLAGDSLGYLKDRLYGQNGLYERYTANNPSSQLRTVESYYDMNYG